MLTPARRTGGDLDGFPPSRTKYRKSDGLFPFVRQHSHSGQPYPMAEAFEQEITTSRRWERRRGDSLVRERLRKVSG
jgi:hypothetical protein